MGRAEFPSPVGATLAVARPRSAAAPSNARRCGVSPSHRRMRRRQPPLGKGAFAGAEKAPGGAGSFFAFGSGGRGQATAERSTKSQWAATPAQRPPNVWQRIALPISSLQFRLSIIEVWVLR